MTCGGPLEYGPRVTPPTSDDAPPPRVRVETFVRVDGEFRPVGELTRYDGSCTYVPGAIVLAVDEFAVLSLDLWDDVDWLWPFVIQALDECRRTGSGRTMFPDQPITFSAETMPRRPAYLLVSVTSSTSRRRVVAPADELYAAVARAGQAWFDQFGRFCAVQAPREESILASWLAT